MPLEMASPIHPRIKIRGFLGVFHEKVIIVLHMKDDVPYYSIHKKTFADRGKSIRHCEGMIYFHYTDYF